MVRFVAQTAVDLTDLTELGLLGHWSQLHTPNTIGNRSHFTVSKGDVKIAISGVHLSLVGTEPILGTVQSLTVSVGGTQEYKLTGLSIALSNIESHFKGNFEPSLFAKGDRIVGSSADDVLYGYAGRDTINGRGGSDDIRGGTHADSLLGGGGKDMIFGGNGNDRINGGLGSDKLNGGAGKDSFVFDYALGANNVDTITDFTHGQDHILLDNGTFTGIGGKGPLASAHFVNGLTPPDGKAAILYDQSTGSIYFDQDGTGVTHEPVLFAKVTAGLSLSASDFLVFS